MTERDIAKIASVKSNQELHDFLDKYEKAQLIRVIEVLVNQNNLFRERLIDVGEKV
jgi:predicted ABC-class ATPase